MATLEQRIYAADQAKLVLENEAFALAMADMKQEITEQWMQSPARDPEGREKLWQLLKLSEKFESILRTSLDTGRLARIELQHNQSMAERLKHAVGLD